MSLTERVAELLKVSKGQKTPGISQIKLANHIGVPDSTLNGWLKNNRDIPNEYIVPICGFFSVSLYWMLTGEESPPAHSLSDQHQELIDIFDALPDDFQRGKVIGYAERLLASLPRSAVSEGAKKQSLA